MGMSGMDWLSLGSGLTTGAAEAIPQALAIRDRRKKEARQSEVRSTMPAFAKRFSSLEPAEMNPALAEFTNMTSEAGYDPAVASALIRSLADQSLYREKTAHPLPARPRQEPAAPVEDPSLGLQRTESMVPVSVRNPEERRFQALKLYAKTPVKAGAVDPIPNLRRFAAEFDRLYKMDKGAAKKFVDAAMADEATTRGFVSEADGPITQEFLRRVQNNRNFWGTQRQ